MRAVELSYTFQSTLSVRRATYTVAISVSPSLISIHALRKESDFVGPVHASFRNISIHALRKESDCREIAVQCEAEISIHALRKESDESSVRWIPRAIFQSTLSVRRATAIIRGAIPVELISIHALRKESDQAVRGRLCRLSISIHALRKESDTMRLPRSTRPMHFNPRSP